MIYVMSDLHGQYDKYTEMLDKIALKKSDSLFILGDICDKGPFPIKILQDMMVRPNVFPIMGDCDLRALRLLSKMNSDEAKSDPAFRLEFASWLQDGGMTTVSAFRELDEEEQADILDYIRDEFVAYDEIEADGKTYLLVHAGVPEDTEDLDECEVEELTDREADFSKEFFSDKILVTGHTPTYMQGEDYRGMIYRRNGQIGIDCGAGESIALGCLCLNTGKEYYV